MKKRNEQILSEEEIKRVIVRISHEIIEKNGGAKKLALVGIRTRGVPLAKRIARVIEGVEKIEIPVGSLDITMYRDDLSAQRAPSPRVQKTEIPFNVTEKIVILVDEVIYTGRTIRCALDALMDLGRPAAIQLVVLVDRGHRELPIRPDYIGKNIPTSHFEEVKVKLLEVDGEDKVEIVKLKEPYRGLKIRRLKD